LSLVEFEIPGSDYTAEVEHEQLTVRLKRGDDVAHVYHVSGCEIGKCCVKDQHSKANTFNVADHRALDYVLAKHNFRTAVYDRKVASGNFRSKSVKIRGAI
jgi:hypothetical protein